VNRCHALDALHRREVSERDGASYNTYTDLVASPTTPNPTPGSCDGASQTNRLVAPPLSECESSLSRAPRGRRVDASRAVAARALQRGRSLMVIPGGEAEQLRTRKGVEELYLAKVGKRVGRTHPWEERK
jgi:hypothetical protein